MNGATIVSKSLTVRIGKVVDRRLSATTRQLNNITKKEKGS